MQILTNTPLWVWPLLFGLSLLGVWMGQAREIKLTRLMVIPFIMILLSLMSLKSLYGWELRPLAFWIGGVGMALYLNRILFQHPQGVVYKSETQSFLVPQSYVPLTLMMGIFITRYCVGVITAMNPALTAEAGFKATTALLLGLFSGGFFARVLKIFNKSRGG